jgi:hypothetical protein
MLNRILSPLEKLRYNVNRHKESEFRPFLVGAYRDMRNYFAQVDEVYAPYSSSFQYYCDLIDELTKLKNLQLVPVHQLSKPGYERAVLGLRHDIDADPITGLRCARFLARKGLSGSFYLLHTAPYYGDFYGEYFLRNPLLKEWIQGFVIAGSEIGIHNDCLHIYLQFERDGITALRNELAWIRAVGAMVRGTVAHNSGPVYGAENYEIFSGRQLWQRKLKTPSGLTVPLGQLSENELGLEYEGTFGIKKQTMSVLAAEKFFQEKERSSVRSEGWMKTYLTENPACDWTTDLQMWLINRDQWVVAGNLQGRAVFEWGISGRQLIQIAAELPSGSRNTLVMHPEYVREIGSKWQI